jgi:phosphatidylglycerophosphate synthase
LSPAPRCYNKSILTPNMETESARRPLKTRQAAWANRFAQLLVKWRVSPNAISLTSMLFALCAGTALYFSHDFSGADRTLLLVLAVAGIQGRLLCNMLDGMVAIEGGRKTKSGEIYNDLPDRVADAVIFIGAGYAARGHSFGVELGFIAAALAIFTAYVRMLGGASGLKQSFIGPMAKQHRMFTLTLACVLAIFETGFTSPGTILWATLIIINLGCLVTIWRRTAQIARELEAR